MGYGLPRRPGKRRPRIRKGIYTNPKPRHSVTSGHSEKAEQQNDGKRNADGLIRDGRENAEIQHDHDGDEDPQEKQKFALREEVGFAGLVNQLGHFAHGAVHRQVLQAAINGKSKDQSEDAKQNPNRQQLVPVHPKKRDLRKVGQFQARLAAGVFLSRGGRGAQQGQQGA